MGFPKVWACEGTFGQVMEYLDSVKVQRGSKQDRHYRDHRHGYVYAIEFEEGVVKVGSSQNARERLKGHLANRQQYGDGSFLHVAVTDIFYDFFKVEASIHEKLSPHLIRGRETYNASFLQVKTAVRSVLDEKWRQISEEGFSLWDEWVDSSIKTVEVEEESRFDNVMASIFNPNHPSHPYHVVQKPTTDGVSEFDEQVAKLVEPFRSTIDQLREAVELCKFLRGMVEKSQDSCHAIQNSFDSLHELTLKIAKQRDEMAEMIVGLKDEVIKLRQEKLKAEMIGLKHCLPKPRPARNRLPLD